MTIQLNLSKWAQAALVAVIAVAILVGKLDLSLPAGLTASAPAVARPAPNAATPADGWHPPAVGWTAPPQPDR